LEEPFGHVEHNPSTVPRWRGTTVSNYHVEQQIGIGGVCDGPSLCHRLTNFRSCPGHQIKGAAHRLATGLSIRDVLRWYPKEVFRTEAIGFSLARIASMRTDTIKFLTLEETSRLLHGLASFSVQMALGDTTVGRIPIWLDLDFHGGKHCVGDGSL